METNTNTNVPSTGTFDGSAFGIARNSDGEIVIKVLQGVHCVELIADGTLSVSLGTIRKAWEAAGMSSWDAHRIEYCFHLALRKITLGTVRDCFLSSRA